MGISYRIFIVDDKERLLRFPYAHYSQLCDDPESLPAPEYANERLCAAEADVEMRDRRPHRIVRLVYFLLPFDNQGMLDKAELVRRQWARLNEDLEREDEGRAATGRVLQGTHRFIAQGGTWKPSAELEALIIEAALGKAPCPIFKPGHRLTLDQVREA